MGKMKGIGNGPDWGNQAVARTKHSFLVAMAFGTLWMFSISTVWAAGPPSLEDLLRQPQYESMTLSPLGDYIAARVPLDDRTVLAIVRLEDMKVTAQLDPGKDGFVDSEFWVGDRRIFASTSKRFGTLAEPYRLAYLYSLDVDGSNRRGFGGNVIDPLLEDPDAARSPRATA